MALIKCYDCGAAIHEHANQCPKCYSHFTKGVQCMICGERMRAKDCPDIYSAFAKMHEQCGYRLFHHTGQCRECGRTIWSKWGPGWASELNSHFHGYDKCGECGVSDPLSYLGTCSTCGLPVYRQIHDVATTGVQHRQCEERRYTPIKSDARAAAEAQRLRRNAASRDNALSGAVVGAVLGGIVMGFSGCVSCLNNFQAQHTLITDFNLFNGLLFGAIGGAVIGVVVGIAIGQMKD